jgi:hypothetical protein
MMSPPPRTDHDKLPEAATALMRMVDFKIPLVWLLGGFIAAVTLLASMYFQLQDVARNMVELQTMVRIGNNQSTALQSEVALIKFRLAQLEAEHARLHQGGKL